MEVRHKIAHMGIVYGRQRLGLPGLMGRGVIGKHANEVDIAEIAELGPFEIDKFASEDKVKELFAAFILHADKLSYQ